jgi:hypothetical protein
VAGPPGERSGPAGAGAPVVEEDAAEEEDEDGDGEGEGEAEEGGECDGAQAANPAEPSVAAAPVRNFRREIGAISDRRAATGADDQRGLGIRPAPFVR